MRQRGFSVGVALAVGSLMATASLGLLAPIVHAEQATTQKVDMKKEAKKDLRLVGNSETKKYHKASCTWAKKISKDNRVEFASAAEAKKAGYEPCKVCLGPTAGTKHAKPSTTSRTTPQPETKKKDATTGQ